MHLLVNELCEYQNARCNDKKIVIITCLELVYLTIRDKLHIIWIRSLCSTQIPIFWRFVLEIFYTKNTQFIVYVTHYFVVTASVV